MDLDLESSDALLSHLHEKDAEMLDIKESKMSIQKQFLHHFLCLVAGCFLAVAFMGFISSGYDVVPRTASYLSPIPHMPQEVRMFEWDYVFTGLPSEASDSAWKSTLPFGRGYVFVTEPKKYDLPPGELAEDGQIYSVALYHQLHCLGIIRRDYFALLDGVYNNHTNVRDVVVDQIENSHNRHCMDYLRQTLECHADMTIEWERTEKDGSRSQVDGMHIAHQCKKKDAIHDFMAKQQIIVASERQKMKDAGNDWHETHEHSGHH